MLDYIWTRFKDWRLHEIDFLLKFAINICFSLMWGVVTWMRVSSIIAKRWKQNAVGWILENLQKTQSF